MTLRLGLLLALLVPVVPWSQGHVDRYRGTFRPQEEVLYLWAGNEVARVFPGFEGLAADLYWLRTVQYFGGQRLYVREKRFELLRPLVEITTALDPRLDIAYRYGAVFLSERPPMGAGRPREGVEVLQEGAHRNPRDWRLRQDLAFFHFLYLHDAPRAAAILEQAADIPGAAFWLRTLSADLLTKGGERASARRMWRQMLDQAEEGVLKQNARLQIQILDALDVADRLTATVAAYEERRGRRPETLDELVGAGLWRGPLADSAGVRFDYDGKTGAVTVSRTSPLWRPF